MPVHAPAEAAPVKPRPDAPYDALVVGGGINGVGIARDLAGRGWRVLLAEADDLGQHTSSCSTKLIHGGLRYLEHYDFALVRKALQERELLLKSAPHIMWPLRFVMPHDASMRPAWMIRIGLFLYDHLARREVLPGSAGVNLRASNLGEPLKAHYRRGFVYSDGWVDDARLVVLNALDAQAHGAEVLTHSPVTRAERGTHSWQVHIHTPSGPRQVQARALVNAAGPWAESFLRDLAQAPAPLATRSLRLVKGSHIVVKRCFAHDHAYIFQNPDRRIIFAIPYESEFTLIGTTDMELPDDALQGRAQARISEAEVSYLCTQASRYFERPIRPSDVVWSYAGVRPLLDDEAGNPSAVTRDYVLETNTEGAPLLSVWGGKITTYRKLAEDAADLLCQALAHPGRAWTRTAKLPGGELSAWIGPRPHAHPARDFTSLVAALNTRYPALPPPLLRRWARAYGSRVTELLGSAHRLEELGAEIAPGLYEQELHFLQREEWATSAADVLWRRSKLGLHYSEAERARVAAWFERELQPC